MIYMVTLAVIVSFAGYTSPKYGLRQKNYKNYIILCGLLMLALTALRSPYFGVNDNYGYMVKYQNLQQYADFRDYYDRYMSGYDFLSSEAGFYYTMWFFGQVLKDGQWVYAISSLLITVATCRFIYKHSVDAPLSLTIYVCLGLFTFNMNAMRQAMAMSICLFAYDHAKNRKLIPFVLTVLLAMLFHKTALCFMPVYFLPALKNRLGSWAFYVAGLIICLLFVDRIIEGYYAISGEDYSDSSGATGGGLFVVLLYVGAIVLTLYRPTLLERTSARIAFLATLAGFVAYLARYVGSDILERVSYYYFYFLMLLIPEAMHALNIREHRLIKVLFIFGSLALFFYRVYGGEFRNFTLFFL